MGDALGPAAAASTGKWTCDRACRGCAWGTAARVSACPCGCGPSPAYAGRGCSVELVVSPLSRSRIRPKAPRHWPPHRPGLACGAARGDKARASPVLSLKAGKKVCGVSTGRTLVGAHAAPGSDLRPPAGPDRAGSGELEEGVRGCASVCPSGPGGGSWNRFPGTHARPCSLWRGAPGYGCCVRPRPSGPRTRAGRGRSSRSLGPPPTSSDSPSQGLSRVSLLP